MRCKKYAAVIIVLLIALLIVVTSAAVPDKEKGMISVASTDNPFSSIHSARYTHMQDTALNTRRIELHDFQLKAENSALALYVNEENAALRVLRQHRIIADEDRRRTVAEQKSHSTSAYPL